MIQKIFLNLLEWMTQTNIVSSDKCKRADEPEALKVVPNKDFRFQYNLMTEFQNAILFKVSEVRRTIIL